eukprot:TRINITY_DN24544_c0_g1_i2.p1 TRINITY_DN24544_c0_g1~~TRINITY_DN24544_c0_g1_i2.p1  ORF type:complete len:978 (-),score=143.05 TRINITY_DN24544_c0_g1_i2:117-3050(-)
MADASRATGEPEEHLVQGDRVSYWSSSASKWIGATVKQRNPDGSYDLNVKRKAPVKQIRKGEELARGGGSVDSKPKPPEILVPAASAKASPRPGVGKSQVRELTLDECRATYIPPVVEVEGQQISASQRQRQQAPLTQQQPQVLPQQQQQQPQELPKQKPHPEAPKGRTSPPPTRRPLARSPSQEATPVLRAPLPLVERDASPSPRKQRICNRSPQRRRGSPPPSPPPPRPRGRSPPQTSATKMRQPLRIRSRSAEQATPVSRGQAAERGASPPLRKQRLSSRSPRSVSPQSSASSARQPVRIKSRSPEQGGRNRVELLQDRRLTLTSRSPSKNPERQRPREVRRAKSRERGAAVGVADDSVIMVGFSPSVRGGSGAPAVAIAPAKERRSRSPSQRTSPPRVKAIQNKVRRRRSKDRGGVAGRAATAAETSPKLCGGDTAAPAAPASVDFVKQTSRSPSKKSPPPRVKARSPSRKRKRSPSSRSRGKSPKKDAEKDKESKRKLSRSVSPKRKKPDDRGKERDRSLKRRNKSRSRDRVERDRVGGKRSRSRSGRRKRSKSRPVRDRSPRARSPRARSPRDRSPRQRSQKRRRASPPRRPARERSPRARSPRGRSPRERSPRDRSPRVRSQNRRRASPLRRRRSPSRERDRDRVRDRNGRVASGGFSRDVKIRKRSMSRFRVGLSLGMRNMMKGGMLPPLQQPGIFPIRAGVKGKGESKGKGRGLPEMPEKFSEDLWEQPRENISLALLGEKARETMPGVHWSYPLNDANRRSYLGCLQCPFKPETTKEFFETIKNGTEWMQPEGKLGVMPRKTAWMVKEGCTCNYRYGGIEVEGKAFPPWMLDIMSKTLVYFGMSNPKDWPNACNLNLYEDGGHSVGWHSDDERLFQGKFQDVRILSLSLGSKRKFEIRANWPGESEKPFRTVFLDNGDLCTMEGMTQKHYQHRVPKEGNVQGPRINLTWRWTIKHTPRCPTGRMRTF